MGVGGEPELSWIPYMSAYVVYSFFCLSHWGSLALTSRIFPTPLPKIGVSRNCGEQRHYAFTFIFDLFIEVIPLEFNTKISYFDCLISPVRRPSEAKVNN